MFLSVYDVLVLPLNFPDTLSHLLATQVQIIKNHELYKINQSKVAAKILSIISHCYAYSIAANAFYISFTKCVGTLRGPLRA